MNQVDIIKSAREILATGAWTKGAMAVDGKYCALGALSAASNLSIGQSCAYWPAQDFLESLVPERYHGRRDLRAIAAFNDDPDTCLEDVVNLFDKALAELGAMA